MLPIVCVCIGGRIRTQEQPSHVLEGVPSLFHIMSALHSLNVSCVFRNLKHDEFRKFYTEVWLNGGMRGVFLALGFRKHGDTVVLDPLAPNTLDCVAAVLRVGEPRPKRWFERTPSPQIVEKNCNTCGFSLCSTGGETCDTTDIRNNVFACCNQGLVFAPQQSCALQL